MQVRDQIFQESPLNPEDTETMLYNSDLTPQGSSLHPSDSAGLLNLGESPSSSNVQGV